MSLLLVDQLPGGGPVFATGFGATCLNRHDATFLYTIVPAQDGFVGVNYTGSGDTLLVNSSQGYNVEIYLQLNSSIMMNQQADITNSSFFLSTNAFGTAYHKCVYSSFWQTNGYWWDEVYAHVNGTQWNLIGQQTVIWSTGPHRAEYNVTWIA